MPFDLKRKGAVYHKLVIEVLPGGERRPICICGGKKCDGQGKAKPKFHNRASEYNGVIYDSALEMRQAVELDWLLRAKQIKEWKRQIRVSFDYCPKCSKHISGACVDHPKERPNHITTYICDFLVFHNDGTQEFLETKGYATDTFLIKWRLMEAVYGNKEGYKLTLVKENANRRFMR